jgi:hypothetical protein
MLEPLCGPRSTTSLCFRLRKPSRRKRKKEREEELKIPKKKKCEQKNFHKRIYIPLLSAFSVLELFVININNDC